MSTDQKQKLYEDIYDDSVWLYNLVENLLSVTKIENGSMELKQQPELLEDVISEALSHIRRRLRGHKIQVHLEDEFLMAWMDAKLIMQVIMNIVDNAIKYTPEDSHIDISAKKLGDRIYKMCIRDRYQCYLSIPRYKRKQHPRSPHPYKP